jgi:hypothetical protein
LKPKLSKEEEVEGREQEQGQKEEGVQGRDGDRC